MSVKIAIVGTGKVARNNYLPYLAQQPDVTLTYYSRTQSRAEACAAEFGGRVTGSVHELLADQPDAVLVLTREEQRFDVTLELLQGQSQTPFLRKTSGSAKRTGKCLRG